ncbi:hypothetical protein, partial [Aeromonas tecta]|uniref:hypothetical protein n=1 Tax=Aeromonas tecta TaxID=324617 RepID=UPI0018DC8450
MNNTSFNIFFYKILTMLLISMLVTSCGGGAESDTSPPQKIIKEIHIEPQSKLAHGISQEQLPIGLVAQYQAVITYTDNTTTIMTDGVLWSTSNSNASVTSTGIVTARTPGAVVISASLDNIMGERRLMISDATLTAIQLTPAAASIVAGLTQQYIAQGIYSDNSS